MRKVLVDQEWLKRLHRDLDACQKVIWLGLRGADPAYCQDAQDRLKEIDELLAQPAEAEGVELQLRKVIDELKAGFVVCQQCGDQEDTATLDCVPELEAIAAALSAVTAERDRLLQEREGKALVPVEPTIEMIAALGFGGDVALAIGHAAISAEVEQTYKAMLNAAMSAKEA